MSFYKPQIRSLDFSISHSPSLPKTLFQADFEALHEAVLRTPYKKNTLPAIQSPKHVQLLNMLSKNYGSKQTQNLKNSVQLPSLEKIVMKSPQSSSNTTGRKVNMRGHSRDKEEVYQLVKAKKARVQQMAGIGKRTSKTFACNISEIEEDTEVSESEGDVSARAKRKNMCIVELLADLELAEAKW